MKRLAGVFFHVGSFDFHPEGSGSLIGFDIHIEVALVTNRFVVLRGLEVLGHVWIEIVLAREPTPRSDRTVQRQSDPNRGLNSRAVDHR